MKLTIESRFMRSRWGADGRPVGGNVLSIVATAGDGTRLQHSDTFTFHAFDEEGAEAKAKADAQATLERLRKDVDRGELLPGQWVEIEPVAGSPRAVYSMKGAEWL
ncbi:hypothetical protein CF123_17765 [Aeromonas veronii]|uniref:Uncharacterized protein n=1 Tax=Aeromonas veronii TaxID=654 RepID=A0AAX2UP55_AERVE|nr:hypothetical protein [Aeromonas veronii]TND51965.1 hypothetical protein CF123_17765 [Aeromonas veronii]